MPIKMFEGWTKENVEDYFQIPRGSLVESKDPLRLTRNHLLSRMEGDEIMYLIFSVPMSSWLTKTATYSSDPEDAKRFSRDEAIKACAGHKDIRTGGFGWLPVYEKDLDAIKERKS